MRAPPILLLLFLLLLLLHSGVGFFDDSIYSPPMPEKAPLYADQSLYITMRDGVRLWTVIYIPKGEGPFGCVLQRAPYSTITAPANALRWLQYGFVYVQQDQRGSFLSRDDYFQFWRMDGQDGYDTMEWIAQQEWSNGNIFMAGLSAAGNAVAAGMLEAPPWLKAIYAMVYTANGHATTYQGGAFRQALVQNWLLVLLFTKTLQDVKENEPFGEWWDPITLPGKEDLCNVPGISLAGWYDIFLNESIEAFNACNFVSRAPGARGKHRLVVDPHGHCTGGEYDWPNGRNTLAADMAAELFLRENGDDVPASLKNKLAEVDTITFYVMGPEDAKVGNYWTTLPVWPSFNSTNFFLQEGGKVSTSPSPASANTSSTYSYNPWDTVRTIGGPELFVPCGPRDQSRLEKRDDVLVFTSAPFKEAMAVVGNLSAVLYVSSDAIDTDFTVKLTDVYPDGRSMLLTDGIIRMRWRESKEVPTWMRWDEIYEIRVDLWKTAYIFEPGHSLRVAVSSSNDPRFEKNLNNGKLVVEGGLPVIAQNTVYFNSQYPSRVTLPVVSLGAIPENFFP